MASRKAVLVTGASSGIGRKVVEELASRGCVVYAGARQSTDLCSLAELENVRPVRLDVTNSQHIGATVDFIGREGLGLYGLVNNAGIATCGPILNGSDAEFDLVMAVNVYAPYRMTKAFAPFIAAAQGRIVTIGSIAGVLAKKDFGPYSMSKLAVEAFTDSLAAELEPAGVSVSVIVPGQFHTNLAKNYMQRVGALPEVANGSIAKEPDAVAAAVVSALFEPKVKRRYLVVTSEEEASRTIKKQLTHAVQMNEGHDFTFDRTSLIAMLDEALAQARPRSA